MSSIYIITTLGKSIPGLNMPDNHRIVGWFKDVLDASYVIHANPHLYEDGHYPYAIIEEIEEGLYSRAKPIAVFKWDKELQAYLYIRNKQNRPKWFRDGMTFGIG